MSLGVRVRKKDSEPLAVDLFAGGGGLTVGLKKAGFKVLSAVEIDPHAAATYAANHPEVNLFTQDIRTISGKEIAKKARGKRIDVLAGCPPCQGFSSLTSKYRRTDPRNFLIQEMERLVDELLPRVVMMENVPGLTQKGNVLFDHFVSKIESLGYVVSWDILQVADYGVPQNRRRLVLLAGHKFKVNIPAPTHSKNPTGKQKPWRTVRDALHGLSKPIAMDKIKKDDLPQEHDWHVVRKLSPQNIERLSLTTPGSARTEIPDKLRPKCHKGLKSGFNNVYGRMSWDNISPTITRGCTTLSMGRFGHPSQLRTISVREAALIQTFPKKYKFHTPYMDRACQIIGNALPCDFAAEISKAVIKALK